MKSRIYAALRVVISLSFIAFLLYLSRDSLGLILGKIKDIDRTLLLLSCALLILSVVIFASRLWVLLCAQALVLRLPETVYLTFIGLFFNNFLPTSIGGDVVKGYYAFKKTGNKLNSFISIFMDRFIGILSVFILAAISLIFSYRYLHEKYLAWVVIGILLILLSVLGLFFNKKFTNIFSPLIRLSEYLKIKEKMQKIYNAINAFKDKKGLILKATLISIVAQIMSFFVIYLLSKGTGVGVSIKMVFLFMPIVFIISMLPSINGLGIREGAIYFLFGPYIGYENAFILSLLWLFMLFLVSFIGGILYLIGTSKEERRFLKRQDGV